MKIILSRKRFDSGSGGYATPIFPDGTMLSLPIPVEKDSTVTTRFQDIQFGMNTFLVSLRDLDQDDTSPLFSNVLDLIDTIYLDMCGKIHSL